jgi:hypothetical protein
MSKYKIKFSNNLFNGQFSGTTKYNALGITIMSKAESFVYEYHLNNLHTHLYLECAPLTNFGHFIIFILDSLEIIL